MQVAGDADVPVCRVRSQVSNPLKRLDRHTQSRAVITNQESFDGGQTIVLKIAPLLFKIYSYIFTGGGAPG